MIFVFSHSSYKSHVITYNQTGIKAYTFTFTFKRKAFSSQPSPHKEKNKINFLKKFLVVDKCCIWSLCHCIYDTGENFCPFGAIQGARIGYRMIRTMVTLFSSSKIAPTIQSFYLHKEKKSKLHLWYGQGLNFR